MCERTTPRGRLCRRAIRVQIHASDETIEIFVEADFEKMPQERRRFGLSTFPATCSVKPPPRRRCREPRPCFLDAMRDVGTVGLFLPRNFMSREAVAQSGKAKRHTPTAVV